MNRSCMFAEPKSLNTVYPASQIAYAFAKKGIEEGRPVSQMQLQKMVYFAHGYHLARYGTPLISEQFQAWKFGPVAPSIYQTFKIFGDQPIVDLDNLQTFIKQDISTLSASAKEAINYTWEVTKNLNALQLSTWSHREGSPWHKHYRPDTSYIGIPNSDVREYFSKLVIQPHHGSIHAVAAGGVARTTNK